MANRDSRSPSAKASSPSTPGRLSLQNLQPPIVSGTSTPLHSPRHEAKHISGASSPSISHRSSFVDSMRGHNQRSPSFSHQALQDLINNPPVGPHDPSDDKFLGRDWRKITVGEIVNSEDVRFAEVDTSVEDATKVRYGRGSTTSLH